MPDPELIDQLATRLRDASDSGETIPPIRDQLQAQSLDDAYAIQKVNTDFYLQQGRVISGRKIGLTAKAVQAQLGVDQPDFGMLWTDMEYGDGQEVPWSRLMQPKIEAEVALVLGSDLAMERPTYPDVLRAVDYAVAALEIVGSRIANWDISIYDTIADNASSSLYVLGGIPRLLDGVDLRLCGMVIEHRGQPVSVGCGAACMGHPLNAAAWLAQKMVEMDMPLKAGDVILTGALGPMVPVQPGDIFDARINGLGSVRAVFGTE